MSTHNICFEQKYEKYEVFFFSENIQFLEVKFSIYLIWCVFVMMYAFLHTSPPEKGSTLKEKNLLSIGANSFL